jgi:hypothetical protein
MALTYNHIIAALRLDKLLAPSPFNTVYKIKIWSLNEWAAWHTVEWRFSKLVQCMNDISFFDGSQVIDRQRTLCYEPIARPVWSVCLSRWWCVIALSDPVFVAKTFWHWPNDDTADCRTQKSETTFWFINVKWSRILRNNVNFPRSQALII